LTTILTWYINPVRGAILRVPEDYPTIQDAINAASPGDTILVSAGIYYENVKVHTTVEIIGENNKTTIVDGSSTGTVFSIKANGVSIIGFTIRNGGDRNNGINLYGYRNAIIRDNIIFNNVVGIDLSQADSNLIEGNLLYNNSMYGIDLSWSDSNTLRNNNISESAYGIELYVSHGNLVLKNHIWDNSYGIYIPYGSKNNVSRNLFTDNSWGVFLAYANQNVIERNFISGSAEGIKITRSKDNYVINNNLTRNSYGIKLTHGGANTLQGNIAWLNDWAIYLYNSTGSTIYEHWIRDNTWGAYVIEGSNGNYLYHNNFIDNVKQAYQDLSSTDNTWNTPTSPYEGNYWSDYIGEDTDGDGIGDTNLPWQGVDWYPLMKPLGTYRNLAIVNVTLSATKVYVGDFVYIDVTVENEGNYYEETFNVTVTYENTTLEIFGTIAIQEVTKLAPGANVTLTFSWNTTDVQPCIYYTIKAEASEVPYEIDTDDNTYIGGTVKIKLPGDVNGDGVVDIWDLSFVAMAYGTLESEPEYEPEADLNRDGIVDMRDIFIVAKNYGETC
jgi:parallel beta-helix repeat protein